MKTIDLFFLFLSRHGVADSFFSNYYKSKRDLPFSRFAAMVKPDEYIFVAFYWGGNPQGFHFWRNIHEAWLSTLSQWQEQTGKAGGHRRKQRR